MKIRKSIYLFIILLFLLPVSKLSAQYSEKHEVNDIDSVSGNSTDSIEEPDTSFLTGSANNRAKQQAVIQRSLPGDTLRKIKSEDDFWYANTSANKQEPTTPQFSILRWLIKEISGKTARFVAWCILIGGLFFFIVFYLVNNEIGLFAPSKRKVPLETPMNALIEDIFEIDFEAALIKSLAVLNYRLAVRLLFLRLLIMMNEKKIITYSPDKTNFDYLFYLNGTEYFNGFSALVKCYEYTWYGEFVLSEQQYALIERNFSLFQQQIDQLY